MNRSRILRLISISPSSCSGCAVSQEADRPRSPSPPKKKSRPLLLEAPGAGEQVAEANRFTYKAPSEYLTTSANSPKASAAAAPGANEGTMNGENTSLTEEDDEEEDEFAKMVCDHASGRR